MLLNMYNVDIVTCWFLPQYLPHYGQVLLPKQLEIIVLYYFKKCVIIIIKNMYALMFRTVYCFIYSVKLNSIIYLFLDYTGNCDSETAQESHEKGSLNINFDIYNLNSDVIVKYLDHFWI